jgi:hypothetical protein
MGDDIPSPTRSVKDLSANQARPGDELSPTASSKRGHTPMDSTGMRLPMLPFEWLHSQLRSKGREVLARGNMVWGRAPTSVIPLQV